MAVKKIRKIGDPVLREKSREVEVVDKALLQLIEDMIDTVSDEDVAGVGLAAPQIGVLKRVIVVNMGDGFETFINPEVEVLDNKKINEEEGCLSIYSVKTNVLRPKKILFKAKNLKGEELEIEAEEIAARIFLHEVDHLNGILFIDHLKPEERKEFLSKINRNNIL
ncbi:MAG: peptide deformylase [Actinobacteria bacterium]|nr:peptide deformylase [Actinomycetota bacterium]